MKVVATYAIKGGVGKTSAAVALSHLAARDGFRTLLWDLDPQGSATFLFRIKPKVKGGGRGLVRGRHDLDVAIKGTDFEGLDLLPADFSYRSLDLDLNDLKQPEQRLRRLLRPLASEYDLVVLDCAPSVSLTSESVVHAVDLLAVPLVPATLAVRSLDQLEMFLDEVYRGRRRGRPQVMAFLSMVDRRKRLHRDLANALPVERDDVVAVEIPSLAVIERMAEERAPVTAYAPGGAAAAAYERLWAELSARLGLAVPDAAVASGR